MKIRHFSNRPTNGSVRFSLFWKESMREKRLKADMVEMLTVRFVSFTRKFWTAKRIAFVSTH